MLHALFLALPLGEPSTPDPASTSNVTVAIVTAIGIVVAAGLTALASFSPRRRERPAPTEHDDEDLVTRFVASLTDERDRALTESALLRTELGRLREAVRQRGADPDEIMRGL